MLIRHHPIVILQAALVLFSSPISESRRQKDAARYSSGAELLGFAVFELIKRRKQNSITFGVRGPFPLLTPSNIHRPSPTRIQLSDRPVSRHSTADIQRVVRLTIYPSIQSQKNKESTVIRLLQVQSTPYPSLIHPPPFSPTNSSIKRRQRISQPQPSHPQSSSS
ncbi:hypothetical protein GJ744_000875 [Endocarpon pusillum]|uniref:Uncharacterized protein n=1 Tax=Endocarpon pusillum TaxID=364733 RepID=A0A8H7ASA7_9EURO|nr:hypothetical protein GJ744_000875 [Endocarpon pusillum]